MVQNEAAAEMHSRAITAGLIPITSAMGKKPDNYKVEYKKKKSGKAFFILRVAEGQTNFRFKLFHLNEYAHLLDNLSETARQSLLSSGGCAHDSKACKGPVEFTANGQDYSLCRHGMTINELKPEDVPAVWALVEEEMGKND